MIANILILLFVLFMAYYWATQGLYSSFLHLCMVVAAGTIAFALWEPVALLLFEYIPRIAPVVWSLALIVPFLVTLSALRLIIDKLLPGNMQFMHAVTLAGGGVLGFASGALTAGVMVIGLSFLPVGTPLAGYQPYAVGPRGGIEATGEQLWLNVDGWAASAFSNLSQGPFRPVGGQYTLAQAHPDLRQSAGAFRLQYDPLASLVAVPDSVELTGAHARETPLEGADDALVDALGEELTRSGQQLVIVDSRWHAEPGTFDADSTLRLPPTQIQLVTRAGRRGETRMHQPVAFTRGADEPTFYPIQDSSIMAFSASSTVDVGWAFLIPADEQPLFVRMRNLRFELPETFDTEPEELLAAIGEVYTEPADDDEAVAERDDAAEPSVGGREGTVAGHVAQAIEQTNALPAYFSRNHATGLTYDDSSVQRGQARVEVFRGGLAQRVRVDSIYEPSHLRMVRVKLDRDQARSLLGAARQAAAQVSGVALEDDAGERRQAVAWVLLSDGEIEVRMDMQQPIRAASELPIRQMSEGDELYLYFAASPGQRIVRYHIGGDTTQEVDLLVE